MREEGVAQEKSDGVASGVGGGEGRGGRSLGNRTNAVGPKKIPATSKPRSGHGDCTWARKVPPTVTEQVEGGSAAVGRPQHPTFTAAW